MRHLFAKCGMPLWVGREVQTTDIVLWFKGNGCLCHYDSIIIPGKSQIKRLRADAGKANTTRLLKLENRRSSRRTGQTLKPEGGVAWQGHRYGA